MNSHYQKITETKLNYSFYISYSFTAGSIGVYLNGLRLFKDLDYTVDGHTVSLKEPVVQDDLVIISWCS